MRVSHILILLVLGAVVGFSIFGVLVSRAVKTEEAVETVALARFAQARAAFGVAKPMLDLDATGNLIGRRQEPDSTGKAISRLRVLAYQTGQGRLIEAEVPFWFVKLKGPALQFAVRGTGLDLKDLEVTPGDLERHGPGLILDESAPNGDRLLVWTE